MKSSSQSIFIEISLFTKVFGIVSVVMMNWVVHLNHVPQHLPVMIVYGYHRINPDVLHGQNVVMEMHFVQIGQMKNSVPIGGVIQIMEHFCVKI